MDNSTYEMLKYATPFYLERWNGSHELQGGEDAFLERLRAWNSDAYLQMVRLAKGNVALVQEYLQTLANLVFRNSGVQLGSDLNSTYRALHKLCVEDYIDIRVGMYNVGIWARPECLLLCLFKFDIIQACQSSAQPGDDLSRIFYDIFVFEDYRPAVLKSGFWYFRQFSEKVGYPHSGPMWVQMEPVLVLKDDITVAFRRQFKNLKSTDPIYTASYDYRNFRYATLSKKDGLVTCATHPRCISYTYDPFHNFVLPRTFKRDINRKNTFKPSTLFGSMLEIYRGESLACIKGGDVDIQNVSLNCDMQRVAEIRASIERDRKTVIFDYEGRKIEIQYEDIPEDAYYQFLHTYFGVD